MYGVDRKDCTLDQALDNDLCIVVVLSKQCIWSYSCRSLCCPLRWRGRSRALRGHGETRGGESYEYTLQAWMQLVFMPKYKQLLKDKATGRASKKIG